VASMDRQSRKNTLRRRNQRGQKLRNSEGFALYAAGKMPRKKRSLLACPLASSRQASAVTGRPSLKNVALVALAASGAGINSRQGIGSARRAFHGARTFAIDFSCAAAIEKSGQLVDDYRVASIFIIFESPLLDGTINQTEIVDAGIFAGSFASFNEIGDGNPGQETNDCHNDHDFNESEARFAIELNFHTIMVRQRRERCANSRVGFGSQNRSVTNGEYSSKSTQKTTRFFTDLPLRVSHCVYCVLATQKVRPVTSRFTFHASRTESRRSRRRLPGRFLRVKHLAVNGIIVEKVILKFIECGNIGCIRG